MSCACACSAPPSENEKIKRCCQDEVKPQKSAIPDGVNVKFDSKGIYGLIRNIMDPEHPLTLEALNVVNESHVQVIDEKEVNIMFTPTIPHCSMATIIGLAIRVKLLRTLPPAFKVSVKIAPGTHVSEAPINKQLADKERVAAAMENRHLIEVIDQCINTDEYDSETLYDKPATCGNPDAVSGTTTSSPSS